jgi:hypothetical protein
MKKLKYILTAITLVSALSYSQGIVILNLKQPPPYGFKLENMWKVTINNITEQTYRVRLRGVATEISEGFIADAVTGVFTLPPGVKIVTAGDIKPIKVNETNPKYEDVVKNVGTVPSGNYDICVYVIDAETGVELASDCISTEVMNLSQVELLSPGDNYRHRGLEEEDASIENKAGSETAGPLAGISAQQISQSMSLVQFSWLPPGPLNPGQRVTYKLKIAQMLGLQSAYDAMQSNLLYYRADNLASTIFQYPIAARMLSAGKYAWQVEAYVNGSLMSSSEVRMFSVGNELTPEKNENKLRLMRKYWSAIDGENNMSGSGTQLKKKFITFGLNSKVYGENANRFGTGSEKEPQYGYSELDPSISFFGLPFSAPMLFSSENSASRQNINTYNLSLDVQVIKDFVMEKIEREKNKLLEKGKKEFSKLSDKQKNKLESDAGSMVRSKLHPVLKIMSTFRALGIGTSYPDYTPLTIRGVPLTGINVEINPGFLYLAFGGFKNKKPIDNVSYKRDIYTGRIGVGQKDGSHLYFTGLFAKDNENSIMTDAFNQSLTPKANYLFGIEGKLDLFRKKLSLEGEVSGAMLTRDTRDADLENEAIPGWVKNIIHPKISSSVDYSYTLKGIFNNESSLTKITAGVRMLGPGYTSLGIPNLSTDKFEVKSKIEQKLSGKQVSLSGELLWYRDNLIEWKRNTTTVTRFSLNAGFRFKGLPSVNILFAPTFMSNNATSPDEKLDNKYFVASIFTGHSYRLKDMNLFTSISYFMNSSSNLDSIITENISVHNLSLGQSVGFKFPLNLSCSFSMSFARYPGEYSRILSGDISADYILFDLVNSFIGAGTSYEKGISKKNTFYIGTSFGYKSYINFEIRAEKNLFHSWQDTKTNYDEFMLKGIVTSTF